MGKKKKDKENEDGDQEREINDHSENAPNIEEPIAVYDAVKTEQDFWKIEDNEDLTELEALISSATREAYEKAVSSNVPIVTVKDGQLVEIKNGEVVRFIREVTTTKVKKGSSFTISKFK